jgi:hypothetical protein
MLISGAAYPAARKLFQSTYKHNIATLDQKVNFYFCILAMLSLHVSKRKNPETFASGF